MRTLSQGAPKRVLAAALGTAFLFSIPLSAQAANMEVSTTGAYAKTMHSGGVERRTVYVKDTLGDNMRAEAQYHRTSTSNPMFRLSASGGAGSTNTDTRSLPAVSLKVCRTNNNPFDIGSCSGWRYP